MATFVSLQDGRTKAQVRMKGHSASQRFRTLTEARAWATTLEAQILAGHKGEVPDRPFSDALSRYADEVSPSKKGERWEVVRLGAFARDPIAEVRLPFLNSKHVAEWRDRRLEVVAADTVLREWNLMQSVCTRCVSEWKWLKENPFNKDAGVSRPKGGKHRDQIFLPADTEAFRNAATRSPHVRVMRVLDFALETAMRSSEIIYLGYEPESVDVQTRVASLPETKNGTARQVPLSARAIELWQEALADHEANPTDGASGSNAWGLTDQTRDNYFRALRELASVTRPEVSRLHFHDARHTWITAKAQEGKFSVTELAAIVGHKDLNELLTYFNPSAATLALKL